MNPYSNETTLKQARHILGTNSEKYSDDQIYIMVKQVTMLTDVVFNMYADSKVKGAIDVILP